MAAAKDRYEEIYRAFRWSVPARLNLADVCCTRWARETPEAPAVLYEHEDGTSAVFTYADLQQAADRLSNALVRHGIGRGDRVAIVMPQRFETAVANMAVQQVGAIAMPLSMLFGPEALEYRLVDSDTRLAIADESSIDNLLAARPKCPGLETVMAVGGAQGRGDVDFNAALVGGIVICGAAALMGGIFMCGVAAAGRQRVIPAGLAARGKEVAQQTAALRRQ